MSWEIFSDNHEVVAADGRAVDLGSWRAASSLLSVFADGGDTTAWERGDNMRSYMGLSQLARRCDY